MTPKPPAGAESLRRTPAGENRLPPAAAVVVAVVVYALLPSSLQFTNRLVPPAVEVALLVALLVALVVTNPRRMTRETAWSRSASIGLPGVMLLTNLVSLGLLVSALVHDHAKGSSLLLGAVLISGSPG